MYLFPFFVPQNSFATVIYYYYISYGQSANCYYNFYQLLQVVFRVKYKKKKIERNNKKVQIKLQWNRIRVLPNAQKHLLR